MFALREGEHKNDATFKIIWTFSVLFISSGGNDQENIAFAFAFAQHRYTLRIISICHRIALSTRYTVSLNCPIPRLFYKYYPNSKLHCTCRRQTEATPETKDRSKSPAQKRTSGAQSDRAGSGRRRYVFLVFICRFFSRTFITACKRSCGKVMFFTCL